MPDTTTSALGEVTEQLLDAERRLRQAEEQVAMIKAEAQDLRLRVADQLVAAGITSVKTESGETIYLRRDVFCSKKGGIAKEEVLSALRDAGLEDFIEYGYVPTSVKSYVEELDRARQKEQPGAKAVDSVPARLLDVFNVSERTSVAILGLKGKSNE